MKTKSMNKVMTILFLITLSTVILSGIANAATIEVKQLGCSSLPDCYTKINDAIFYAQQDDTIKVYPGRYEEAVVINKNLTLIGSGPEVTTIYSSLDGITINQYISATIIGFTIRASQDGIFADDISETIIRNNVVVSNGDDGIYINCAKSTIINNVIANNMDKGIETNSCSNNFPDNVTVTNNIVFNNKYGLYLGSEAEYILYNNVYSNVPGGNYYGCSAGTGDISQNPLFIDSSNGNYVLQSTSPSKNAGTPGSADADPDGTRNDMGAYGGPDAAGFWPYPPGAPIITNLTVTPTTVQKGETITINATGEIR